MEALPLRTGRTNCVTNMQLVISRRRQMDWYNQGPIECIDAMESAFGVAYMAIFCRINAMKYLWRCSHHTAGPEDRRPRPRCRLHSRWHRGVSARGCPIAPRMNETLRISQRSQRLLRCCKLL
eukprot:SAG25_NODE_3600_length_1026_cov_2.094930_1_plen_123_part_00